MKSFSITDIGIKRKVNQDYVFCDDKQVGGLSNLFIVADGMGGHNAGDYASRFSVKEFVEQIKQSKETTPIKIMEAAIQDTNEALLLIAKDNEEFEGMGTTFVAATIEESTLHVANIGDSRLYVIHDDIIQITRDHSLVEEMVRLGKLKKEEVKGHPNKNVVTRALGTRPFVGPDFFEVGIHENDIVLMCTDGLSNMLEDEKIFHIVKSTEDIEEAAKLLIQEANHNGGIDNIGIVIVKL